MKFKCILIDTHNTELHRIKSIHQVKGASQFDLKIKKLKVEKVGRS